MRRSVDVLTLTATPIPRSLHMAMIGVRDMSVIETPPEGRLPIRTYLQPFDEYHIREAILRELDRGGQVYFVHNKVQTIQAMAARLRRLVPEARVAIAHGQMPEDELERVMSAFAAGEDSVLVCSSIIENGLDLPNVNTMIVNDAANFGLAQLYQLRGRIGRGSVRAYAYLLYRRDQRITRTAERRLRAVFEASELGAGFKIAMQDLEIRGAGNLLGPEQSGNISTVGFDLYSKLLARAIQERQGRATADEEGVALAVAVDLPLHMYIPSDYVQHDSPRLALYRRLASVGDTAALDELDDEIRDRFGPLPQPVANLLFFVRVKVLAARAGLAGVALDETLLTLRGRDDTLFDRLALYRRFGMDARVVRGVLRVPRSRLGADWQEVLLALLEETSAANTPARPSARTALAAGQS
jgi:transcription-repair coupling factor (superfamily II helicase)